MACATSTILLGLILALPQFTIAFSPGKQSNPASAPSKRNHETLELHSSIVVVESHCIFPGSALKSSWTSLSRSDPFFVIDLHEMSTDMSPPLILLPGYQNDLLSAKESRKIEPHLLHGKTRPSISCETGVTSIKSIRLTAIQRDFPIRQRTPNCFFCRLQLLCNLATIILV